MEELVHIKANQLDGAGFAGTELDRTVLEGILVIPKGAKGLVLFAHGSGSGRHSPRNIFVATALNKVGFATLLIDLLSQAEDQNYQTRFDIALLTQRVVTVIRWLQRQQKTCGLQIGLFGASTGAAAALYAAVQLPATVVKAVVSRGGRPDMAQEILPQVQAPTLIIVGGDDYGVIELNQAAYDALIAEKCFEVVPGATHLFEEPGCLEEVAHLATNWFRRYLLPHQTT